MIRFMFRFLFFSCECGMLQNLVTGDVNSIQRSGLDSSRRLLFIVHGYLEHGNKKWIKVC